MSFALALALVPAPLVIADWSIDTATMAQSAPVAIAMQANPAPPPVDVAPPPDLAVQPVPPPTLAPAPPVVVGKHHHTPGDPFETFNRSTYGFSMAVDKAILRPVALGYRQVVPRPARDGVRNVLSNIGEPLVFVNDLLQLKIGRAGKTLGRFVINSTL